MEERLKLSRDSTSSPVDAAEYWRLIGSLRYLVNTWPELAFSVGFVSRFMEQPTSEHMTAVKRILRYIAGTSSFSFHYKKRTGKAKARLIGYSDSDHVGDVDTRKGTSGILFFLGKSLVSWQSLKQRIVALSSCEAEYIAATTATSQGVWLARLLGELKGREADTTELGMDNKSALALSKNPVFHERSKHIQTRYHYIRECVENGSICASFVSTKDQLADILTKALGRVRFQELRTRIGMVQINVKP
ncbi:secreted RxLR effector protein 161-like [Phragmites australis]|uniref:secreted RxLR effector protein 161-like n=1 Tax=Phragmites australis TaxID=29695 RepID=UPI002D7887D0|nr:secreted RxLR effector protein 161-like [Phragmites australis]